MLQSESSSKKNKGKGKSKGFKNMSDPPRVVQPLPRHSEPSSKDAVDSLISKKRPVTSGSWLERKHVQSCRQGKDSIHKERAQAKGKRSDKRKARATNKTRLPKASAKERVGTKGEQSKDHSSTRKGKKQGLTQERFHRWRAQRRANMCMSRRSLDLSTYEARTMLRRIGGRGWNFLHEQLSPVAPR